MTLITIAPGVRVLRRHPDRDVLIVEGLGEYATLFIESIPGGWCVVNGEAATKRIYDQVRQCEDGGMEAERDAYRKAKAENGERFQIERDEARRTLAALREYLDRSVADEISVDEAIMVLEGLHNEDFRRVDRWASAMAEERNDLKADRDELRLSLLAEHGDIKGAPDGWKRTGSMWFRPLGPVNHQVEVRRSTIHPTGEPYHWTLYTPTLTAEGYAPYAREAMKRADKAHKEKA